MFKNMDFHRYVAKKDFCFQNTSFENHKLQIEIRKNATLLFMDNKLLWTKTMVYLRAFTCLSARLARATCPTRTFYIREFKIWRRQRQRHKSIIWLVERRKLIVLHVQHAFGAMFWRSLPNDNVKFSYLTFWRQRELAAVNLSFFAVIWKIFVPSKRKCTSPILYNVTNME